MCGHIGKIIIDEDAYILYRQHGSNTVGLSHNLKNRLKRAFDYVFNYKPSVYAAEIISLYSTDMSIDNRDFFDTIANANKNKKCRIKLTDYYKIAFNRKELDLLFRLKLCLKKM